MLIAVIALSAVGCTNTKTTSSSAPSSAVTSSSSSAASSSLSTSAAADGKQVLGEGATQFGLIVTDKDGNESEFEIHTDKATVGEALLDLQLIEGETSEYGLYVKTVNGITADYDKDGVYWAFYVNGEYATAGVDSTEITEDAVYALKVE
ncbi:MAG: DUF4430 domain-containing protein [Oscillospiraceae bacterium]|nr:DUF4430 domain-containing protein [Oscillospiraceae bacterium]